MTKLLASLLLIVAGIMHSCINEMPENRQTTTIDIFGNQWKTGKDFISVQPFDTALSMESFHASNGLPAGEWSMIIADQYGYVWAGGKQGLIYFDPLNREKGWTVFVADNNYPGGELKAMKMCESGQIAVELYNGIQYRVDIDSESKQLSEELATGGCETAAAWKQGTPMPYGAHDVYGAVLGNKIYIPGGAATHGYPVDTHYNFDRMLVYDTDSKSWEVTSPMKINRRYCNVGMLDNKIWVLGGYHKVEGKETPVSSVEIYNPVNQQWTAGPSLDKPCVQSVSGVINKRLYVIFNVEGEKDSKMYSIAAEESSWREEAGLDYVVNQTDGAVFDNKLYVVIPENGLVMYDPLAGEWNTELQAFPGGEVPRAAAVGSFGDRIWVISGNDIDNLNSVSIYSPKEDSWVIGPEFPKPVFWADAVEVNGTLHVFGGATYDKLHKRYVFWNTLYTLDINYIENNHN